MVQDNDSAYVRTKAKLNEIEQLQNELKKDISEYKQHIGRDGNIASDDWATPSLLIETLEKEFDCEFYDPCPLGGRHGKDGLIGDWQKWNFVNPPYNRTEKPLWIKKVFEQQKKGSNSILLIPAATGTADFADIIFPHAEIRFFVGRIKFLGKNTKGEFVVNKPGKHDSMLCIFKAEYLTTDPPPPSLICSKTFESYLNLPF